MKIFQERGQDDDWRWDGVGCFTDYESFLGAEIILIAVIGDANAADQFHDKVGATSGEWSAGFIPQGRGSRQAVRKF